MLSTPSPLPWGSAFSLVAASLLKWVPGVQGLTHRNFAPGKAYNFVAPLGCHPPQPCCVSTAPQCARRADTQKPSPGPCWGGPWAVLWTLQVANGRGQTSIPGPSRKHPRLHFPSGPSWKMAAIGVQAGRIGRTNV